MGRLRIAWRLFAVTAICLVIYAFLALSALAARFWGWLRGRPGLVQRWRIAVFNRWTYLVGAVLGLRVTTHGAAPRPPFVLVSNHLSYLDVILLGSHLRCAFVAKAEVADWPVIGALCRSVQTLFIDRESKRDIPRVMRQMDEILERGTGIVFFPEGTTSKGDSVQRFRPSLLELAARSGRPVWYASVSYSTPPGNPPAHESVCWWGNAPFTPHFLGLLRLPRIDARLEFGEQPILESDRKILAARLRDAVQRQFRAVV